MYLKMFHKIKKIFCKLYTRTKALFRYLVDYPIAGISVLYLLLQYPTIFLSRNITMSSQLYILLLILLLTISLLLYLLKKELFPTIFLTNNRQKILSKILTPLLIILFILLFQLLRFYPIITTERKIEKQTKGFTKSFTAITACLRQEIDEKYSYSNATFSTLQALGFDGQNIQTEPFKILVKIPKFKQISVGQVCKLEGQLVEPKNSDNFNYKNLLKNRGVFFLMEFPQITCTEISQERRGFFLKNILMDIKNRIVRRIEFILSEPQTSLLVGILFGSDRLFSKNFEKNLRVAGVSHVISASGYNITVLALLLNRMFFFHSQKR